MDGPAPTGLRKPHFETMMQLEPDSRYNVKVKVVSYETLSVRKRIDGNIVEVGQALVGDTYACAHLILRGEQVKNFSAPGTSLILRNAHTRVDRTGHIKLNVDIWGKIEIDKVGISGEVNLKNNISDAEYEAVYNDPKPGRGGYGGGRGGGDYHRGGGGDYHRGGRGEYGRGGGAPRGSYN